MRDTYIDERSGFEDSKRKKGELVSSVAGDDSATQRLVTPEELKQHNTPEDCWVAFHGTVYNMTVFSQTHPGGPHLIQDIAGMDGTKQFGNVHKKGKLRLVEENLIGQLSG